MHRNRSTYRPNANTRPSRQRGLSLLEMLIALALSGTLMAGVVGVFMGMFQTDRSQEGVSRIQEAGRFALNFMGQDIRMAGYQGCSSTMNKDNYNTTLDSIPASFQPDRNVQGWEANNTDPGDINNAINSEAVISTGGGWGTSGGNVLDNTSALPGTDIIRVWGADPTVDTEINSIVNSPLFYKTVNVDVDNDIDDGDILLFSDCTRGEWVQVCTVNDLSGPPASQNLVINNSCTPGNSVNPTILSGAGSRVYKLGGTVYYIGKRNNVSTNPPALFRRQLGSTGVAGNSEELVEGVEDMQILYGENTNDDNNNSADRYVPADQIGDWDDVVSIRISILVQSIEDNLVPDPVPYVFNGVTYDGGPGNGNLPPDGRLRRVFTSTINLRNVTLGG